MTAFKPEKRNCLHCFVPVAPKNRRYTAINDMKKFCAAALGGFNRLRTSRGKETFPTRFYKTRDRVFDKNLQGSFCSWKLAEDERQYFVLLFCKTPKYIIRQIPSFRFFTDPDTNARKLLSTKMQNNILQTIVSCRLYWFTKVPFDVRGSPGNSKSIDYYAQWTACKRNLWGLQAVWSWGLFVSSSRSSTPLFLICMQFSHR